MAKISSLPVAASPLTGSEVVPAVQAGYDVSISLATITDFANSGLAANLATLGVMPTAVTVTDATFTLANDPSKFYLMDSDAAQTFTVPSGMTAWKVGSVATVIQLGAGAVTIAQGTDAVISMASSVTSLVSKGQYEVIQFINIGADSWLVLGGLGG